MEKPLRSCIVCRKVCEKSDLLRFVFGSSELFLGELFLDFTQTAKGRGFYIHPSAICLCGKKTEGAIIRLVQRHNLIKGNNRELYKGILKAVESGEIFLKDFMNANSKKVKIANIKVEEVKKIISGFVKESAGLSLYKGLSLNKGRGIKKNFGFKS